MDSALIGATATLLVTFLSAFCWITWRLLRDLQCLKIDVEVIKIRVVETVQIQTAVRSNGENITRLQEQVRAHSAVINSLSN